MEKILWSALEYEEKERSRDWFWALGIIVVTGSITAVIFGNYFFAALLILGGILLGFFAVRKPEMVFYELADRGLKVRGRLYTYENIKAFWVQASTTQETEEVELKPLLFIRTERIFMPVMVIPIPPGLAPRIRSIFMAKEIPEERMKEHLSLKIMESLGF